jgi:endogenous inhibitor of DNA gyrase (YacG/DUF329 family)
MVKKKLRRFGKNFMPFKGQCSYCGKTKTVISVHHYIGNYIQVIKNIDVWRNKSEDHPFCCCKCYHEIKTHRGNDIMECGCGG